MLLQSKFWGMPRHNATAPFVYGYGTTNLRNGAFRRSAVDHHQVRRMADLDAILVKTEDTSGAISHHGEALAELMGLTDL